MISLLELNLSVVARPEISNRLDEYEKYCNEELPKVGEIISYNGFCDW